MRTYSGHSTAAASNELYRTNLAKGQTGLSVAFDLPTQTGYDPDSPMARGEVGKVGVPISHLGDMRTLLDGIPPAQMNTSMTINATAAWLLALYVANAEEQGVGPAELRGTTQNDIVKEYLSRGTYIFPPGRVAAADRRHRGLVRGERADVEPDQRLLVPPAGGRRDPSAGAGLLAGDGGRGARRRARVRPGAGGSLRPGVRIDLLLRQRRDPLRRGDLQAARLRRALGAHRPRALRRHRPEGAAVPLRRAGQQPRTHRGPAGEQRAADRPRDARRDVVQVGAGSQHPAPGMERGARPAAAVGSAVVVADATGARLRERHPRVRRHLRRLRSHRGAYVRALRTRLGRARRDPGDGWRVRRRRDVEVATRLVDGRAHPPDRVRRAGGRRRQSVHRDGTVPARRRRGDPARRPPGRG